MIELNTSLNSDSLGLEIALRDILNNTLQRDRSEDIRNAGVYVYNRYGSRPYVKINSETGNAVLTSTTLLYYPSLIKALRQITHYPIYTANISFNSIEGVNGSKIEEVINSLHSLNNILATHREEKALLDANVNNLVMLYGQTKEKPIYNGSKPYCKRRSHRYNKREISHHIFYISGVRYFSGVPNGKYYLRKSLYELSPYQLLETHLKNNSAGYRQYNDDRFVYVKGLVGGITNTPILIFRCAQSREHKGKYYYLDLHTNNLLNKLSEARNLAQSYAGCDYKIDIWETDG